MAELRALVFDAVARHNGGPLPVDPFLESIGGSDVAEREPWRELERRNLLNALRQANWKISGKGGAAELLEIKPSTLESRMKAFAIERPTLSDPAQRLGRRDLRAIPEELHLPLEDESYPIRERQGFKLRFGHVFPSAGLDLDSRQVETAARTVR